MDIRARGRQAALLRLARQGTDPLKIADSAVAIWHEVDRALTPIIGAGGINAVYKRSVHLIRADYPWLHAAYAGAADVEPFAVLKPALSQHPPMTAAAANGALLQAFYNVLENLIGGPLTTRLLHRVMDNVSTGDAE